MCAAMGEVIDDLTIGMVPAHQLTLNAFACNDSYVEVMRLKHSFGAVVVDHVYQNDFLIGGQIRIARICFNLLETEFD